MVRQNIWGTTTNLSGTKHLLLPYLIFMNFNRPFGAFPFSPFKKKCSKRKMENLADIFISQILDSLDSSPVYPAREQKFLAFLICKNLTELCETGEAILHDIEIRGCSLKDLPDYHTISLCQQTLKTIYLDSMFIQEKNNDIRPNWSVIESFDPKKTGIAYKIYRAIQKNITESHEIQKAIRTRDRTYFIKNYNK